MKTEKFKDYQSHGSGTFTDDSFKSLGNNVIFESGVLVFHPNTIIISDNVYIGHNTILKGYHQNSMEIGEGTWIGQNCYFHSAGGIRIGKYVGIGPHVKIITSNHVDIGTTDVPVIQSPLEFKAVSIDDGADIGIGSVILPGIKIGQGAIVGAGAVVTRDVEPFTVAAGVPARFIRRR